MFSKGDNLFCYIKPCDIKILNFIKISLTPDTNITCFVLVVNYSCKFVYYNDPWFILLFWLWDRDKEIGRSDDDQQKNRNCPMGGNFIKPFSPSMTNRLECLYLITIFLEGHLKDALLANVRLGCEEANTLAHLSVT